MKVWQLRAGAASLNSLQQVEVEKPTPRRNEVLVRVRACSINNRDQMIAAGVSSVHGRIDHSIVPLSDGVGEIEAIGPDVKRYRVGDRVAGAFHQNWTDGRINANMGPALGGTHGIGMLAEYVALPETGVVPMAASLSYDEAATLPCAGVTAWNALMEGRNPVKPGDQVLLQGTGGVSLLALQIAKAAGASVILISSSETKLARAGRLGADHLINYRAVQNWGVEAAKISGRGGVDHVIDIGGADTLDQSIQAIGYGGEISVLRGGELTALRTLLVKGSSVRGIFVGSAAMAKALNTFIDEHGIKPVIDRTFSFGKAKTAFSYQSRPDLFGKVVIRT